MKRKDFLKFGAVGLTAIASGRNIIKPQKSVRPSVVMKSEFADEKLKKGFMLGTFPSADEFSVLEKFTMLRDAGFDGVEPSSGLDRQEVLAARDQTGLEIPSVVVSTHWSSPLSSADSAVRQEGLNGLETALYDAHEYGASNVLLVPGVVNNEVSYDEVYRRSQQEIKKMIPLAEELEVVIAVENVWNHFLLSPMEAARYIDEFESPWIGWYFDVGNILNYGWPHHWIQVLGERIVMIHIKEFSRQKRNDEGLWRGFAVNYLEGDNDWLAIMKSLKNSGYTGYAIAEPAFRNENIPPAEFLTDYVSKRMDNILDYF